MAALTPEQFARQLRAVRSGLSNRNRKAIEARTKVTQRYVEAAATASSKRGRKFAVSGRWVRSKLDGDTGEVRLRTGFGFLTERGSYLHTEGWDESPKQVTARRRKNAAKRGVDLQQKKAMPIGTYGFATKVHHPFLHAQPFWELGVQKSKTPGSKAYEKEIIDSLWRGF